MEITWSFAHTEAFSHDQQQRRMAEVLYHCCMDPVVEEINQLCSEDNYFRFADGKVRLGRCFWHLLSMDGLEIAATTMCSTDECPVCEVPKDELDKTDVSYPLLSGSTVKALVEDAQALAELLEPDCSVKPRCIGKVGHIVYDIPSYIIYYIIP